MSEPSDTRQQTGGLAREAVFTLLFAVVAMVVAVTLIKTLTRPLATGSLSLVQWALFAVTAVGATLGFVRAMRFYVSLSLLARLRRARPDDDASDPEPGRSRLHPVLDDLSWGAITLAIAAINVLAVSAVVLTLADLFGETRTATSWLLWQLAVLIAALAGVVGLSRAIVAELRDRSRRRRRNAVHVITNKLIYWPVKPGRSPTTGRRTGRVGAAAAAAVLAGVSWASASGPLLEPAPERDPAAAGVPVERTARTAAKLQGGTSRRPASARSSRADPSSARGGAGTSRTRRLIARSRKRERGRREPAPVAPPATSTPSAPVASTPPPAPTAPATSEPPATPTQPQRTRSNRRGRKPRRGGNDRARPMPTPSPTPTPTPAPSATPSPTPSPMPSPTPGPPCGQPPCGVGEGAPPPR